ncbi:MAG: hypothetical protein FWE88_04795 [Phycisphaerae bacterium]|nr:hypothetical protein [Phycisphaerae bacterium]
MATGSDNSPAGALRRDDGVCFADAFARALLRARLAAVDDPPAHGAALVKRSVSRTVWRVSLDGQDVYVKQYHKRAFGHRLLHGLGVSQVRHEAKCLRSLSAAGFPVPRLLAWCHRGRRQWVCTLGVPDAEPLDVWYARQLAQGLACHARVRQATAVLARLVGALHRAGNVHRDLHMNNVLIREWADASTPAAGGHGAIELFLLDLHRMKVRPVWRRRAMMNDLAYLFHDCLDSATRADRVRFLVHYLDAMGGEGTRRDWQMPIERHARSHSRRQFAKRQRRMRGGVLTP